MKSISLRGRFNAGDGREGEAPAEPTPRRNVMFFAAPGWLIAGAVILTITMPLRAQDEPRQYKRFDIDPGIEKLFKDRLKMEQQLGPLKDLIKQIAADPSKMPLDPEKFKDLMKDDNFKTALKDWARQDPQLKEALTEWLKENPADGQPANVKQFQDELKRVLDADPRAIKRKDLTVKIEEPKAKPESLAKVTERAMKRAENTGLGDWLRDSPAWNRALGDLRSSIGNPDAERFKLGDWQEHLRLPDDGAWKFGEGTLDRIKELPTPDLDFWTPTTPELGPFPSPDLSAPSLPEGPTLPSVRTGGTWLLLAVMCLLVGWQMLRWRKRSTAGADARVALGPWPVRPEAVMTRAELVQAFDYLALLTLGLGVQSWNHQAVARQWLAKSPPCAEPAQALALLYEQARYTDGVETLTDAQRELARRSLLQLAEAL